MGSTSSYQGRLAIQSDSVDLVVDLRFEGETLEISTCHESLGRWPMSEVEVSQLNSGIFSIRLGTENVLFAAVDPPGFALQAIPARFRGRHLKGAMRRTMK